MRVIILKFLVIGQLKFRLLNPDRSRLWNTAAVGTVRIHSVAWNYVGLSASVICPCLNVGRFFVFIVWFAANGDFTERLRKIAGEDESRSTAYASDKKAREIESDKSPENAGVC